MIDLAELGFAAISAPDPSIHEASCRRLDSLTKPLGALGRLEALAAQICAVQRTLEPAIVAPVAIVFAADHGVADRGVSAYPRAVTREMVKNFLAGGAAINVLARIDGMELWVVDAGVDGECAAHARLIDAKIRMGTRDFTAEAAMTAAECRAALGAGRRIGAEVSGPRGNALVLGEMGIGNTASSALLMHALTGHELPLCVGRGTGLDDAGLARKQAVLAEAARRVAPPRDPFDLLCEFGGYEIAMLTGAILGAASRRQLVLVDGFTVTVAAALAARIDANALGYCVFGHCSAENAHRALLRYLNVLPLLDLGMRLGEGSGAALALPLVRAALALFRRMATFEGAGVSQKIA
ncbi:MAG TPA: nicotinate-nucleotide--dimethylbenzimidazole phosphoribosyltransferase [Steroidobacteraceae bacterium]|nr:nicotinate-nucleotide--dimethylbenzimidazole phosphoribosyltransferase [Steroidobacteraceae bacterium]